MNNENEKIVDVVKAFKAAFGEIEFKAVQAGTGLTVVSRGWVEPPAPRLEISGDDFIALGKKWPPTTKGVVSGLLKIMGGAKIKCMKR
jgi:hypothetical protein